VGTGSPGYDEMATMGTQINNPRGMSIDKAGRLYFADTGNSKIRRVDFTSGSVRSVAGNLLSYYYGDGGLAVEASLNRPNAVALGPTGQMQVVDQRSHTVREIQGLIFPKPCPSTKDLLRPLMANTNTALSQETNYLTDLGNLIQMAAFISAKECGNCESTDNYVVKGCDSNAFRTLCQREGLQKLKLRTECAQPGFAGNEYITSENSEDYRVLCIEPTLVDAEGRPEEPPFSMRNCVAGTREEEETECQDSKLTLKKLLCCDTLSRDIVQGTFRDALAQVDLFMSNLKATETFSACPDMTLDVEVGPVAIDRVLDGLVTETSTTAVSNGVNFLRNAVCEQKFVNSSADTFSPTCRNHMFRWFVSTETTCTCEGAADADCDAKTDSKFYDGYSRIPREFFSGATEVENCHPGCGLLHFDWGAGNNKCCGSGYLCGEHEGSCNSNDDCQTGLVCGVHNCLWGLFGPTDNCCKQPDWSDFVKDTADLSLEMGYETVRSLR